MKHQSSLTSVLLSVEQDVSVTFEPYGYTVNLASGDKLEATFDASDQQLEINISATDIVIGCYEPVLRLNGMVHLDLSQPSVIRKL